jgi:superfamily I DNA/RNA helicase/RecB family exonuclease
VTLHLDSSRCVTDAHVDRGDRPVGDGDEAVRGAGTFAVTLTAEQRAAVEWTDGPLMVLAGAGTGKTTVIVERVAWLLGTRADGDEPVGRDRERAAEDGGGANADVLQPEQILVLTYNTRAAAELVERLERRLGVDVAGRLWVDNYHAFGHRVLRDHRDAVGLPDDATVLDQVGQQLLLRDLRPGLDLLYHGFAGLPRTLGHFVEIVNRARDELVTPDQYRAFAEGRRAACEREFGAGAYEEAIASLRARGDLGPVRQVRRAYLAGDCDGAVAADREARRQASGIGRALPRDQLTVEQRALADGLAPAFLRDAAALEALRLDEEARVYEAYVTALRERGQLDYGEQILRTIELFERRPDVLVAYQRRFRHILVDEFQDANIAQILLLELLGRAPGRQDNVVVVGDDDQSVYRFRGASYAAFEQFRVRFGCAPAWDPDRAVRPVGELPLQVNRRSGARILAAAGRLIEQNPLRMKQRTPLIAHRAAGRPVEVIVAEDETDEANLVVDRIRRALEDLPEQVARPDGTVRPRRWSDVAVLYRKHRHRELIEDRLRRAGIPSIVVGGAGVLAHPDVRDVVAALRVAADPADSVSFTRLLTAGPWSLDALEIVRLTRAAARRSPQAPDGRPVHEAALDALNEGVVAVDAVDGSGVLPSPSVDAPEIPIAPAVDGGPADGAGTDAPRRHERPIRLEPLDAPLRSGLARLFACLEGLGSITFREGPFAVLDEYLVRTGLLHDLIAAGTLEAHRRVLALARFMRFVSDWQQGHPRACLADFLTHLDVFEEAGGDLETEAPGGGDVDGVQLMTIHQAKGLEYEIVVVPRLIEGQFPVERSDDPPIPIELLRQKPPGDFAIAEERRLAFVAMTRARSRLILSTIDGGRLRPSCFVAEVAPAGNPVGDVEFLRREPQETLPVAAAAGDAGDDGATARPASAGASASLLATETALDVALLRRMPVPAAHERRFALRRRAVEIIGALELLDPEDEAARLRLIDELIAVGREASGAGGEARALGLDPLTLRVLAMHAPAGEELLRVVPAPDWFSHTSLAAYAECPLRWSFDRLYRIPVADDKPWFAFGSLVHAAFESFGRAEHAARAAGIPGPTEADLERSLDDALGRATFPDAVAADTYRRRSKTVARNFHARHLARLGESLLFEQQFALALDPPDGRPPVHVVGVLDRVDRLADGSIELIDYKTGQPKSQSDVDRDEQLSTYALAFRAGAIHDPDGSGPLPVPAKLTLYFTEADQWISTTRTDAQLDQHLARLLESVARIRAGDFAAAPSYRTCGRCDFRRICPSRWGDG